MHEIIHSPLCQVVRGEGTYVDIQIYRSSDSEWSLEVIDETGASTVWDDLFPTDQSALDEALQTIREDGIRSVMLAEAALTPSMLH